MWIFQGKVCRKRSCGRENVSEGEGERQLCPGQREGPGLQIKSFDVGTEGASEKAAWAKLGRSLGSKPGELYIIWSQIGRQSKFLSRRGT